MMNWPASCRGRLFRTCGRRSSIDGSYFTTRISCSATAIIPTTASADFAPSNQRLPATSCHENRSFEGDRWILGEVAAAGDRDELAAFDAAASVAGDHGVLGQLDN